MLHKAKRGFTLVELLVVIAIIGILVSMLLPAVQSVRETARRTHCMNNLRQIGLATISFHGAHGAFPPSRISSPRDALSWEQYDGPASWLVRIMPFIEQDNLYQHWDLKADYEKQTDIASDTPVSTFICSSRRTADNAFCQNTLVISGGLGGCGCGSSITFVGGGATGDYAGNHGDPSPGFSGAETDYNFPGNGTGVIVTGLGILDDNGERTGNWKYQVNYASITDGSSNTFLSGEMHIPNDQLNVIPYNGPIFNGKELVAHSRIGGPGIPLLTGEDPAGQILGFGSAHPGTCNFVRADGSTAAFDNNLDTLVLANLCHRADGEVVVSQ